MFISVWMDDNLAICNQEVMEEDIGLPQKNGLSLKILLVVWKFFEWQEESMSGTTTSYWEFEKEIWKMSYGYAELWNSKCVTCFDHEINKWFIDNFYGGAKTVLIWNWDVVICCETLNTRYCEWRETVQSNGAMNAAFLEMHGVIKLLRLYLCQYIMSTEWHIDTIPSTPSPVGMTDMDKHQSHRCVFLLSSLCECKLLSQDKSQI